MITYLAVFQPIDLFDPSSEMILIYLFFFALALIALKVYLRKRYHRLVDTLPLEANQNTQATKIE